MTSFHCPTARGRPWWLGHRTWLWSAVVSWQVSALTWPSWCDPSCWEALTRTWRTAPESTWRGTASSSSANLSQPRWADQQSALPCHWTAPDRCQWTHALLTCLHLRVSDRGTGSRHSWQAEGDGQVHRKWRDHRGRVQHCKHRPVLPPQELLSIAQPSPECRGTCSHTACLVLYSQA